MSLNKIMAAVGLLTNRHKYLLALARGDEAEANKRLQRTRHTFSLFDTYFVKHLPPIIKNFPNSQTMETIIKEVRTKPLPSIAKSDPDLYFFLSCLKAFLLRDGKYVADQFKTF